MRAAPVDLIGGFYTDDAKPWSLQDTVNWLPEVAEAAGTRTQWKMRGAPGLISRITGLDGPIRGARNVEGKFFVVAGRKLYEIKADLTALERGVIPGFGRVGMSHNQLVGTSGNQLIIVTGDSSWVWNTLTNSLLKITDPGYPGAYLADYIDQFLVQPEKFGRFWFHSDLADALSYNTLDRYSSEASPDAIVGLAVNQFEVVVFNQRTIEYFANRGTAQRTFQSKRTVVEVGCAGRYSIAKLSSFLFFLGHDGAIYMTGGGSYGVQKISTACLEKAIAGLNWSAAFSMVYESEGHKIYYLTFPDGQTFGYDLATQLWTRRESFGLKRWRANSLTFWEGRWWAGDFQDGTIFEVDWDTYAEGSEPLIAEKITGPLSDNQSAFTVDYVEMIVNTGTAPLALDHALELTYSDDGGRNWKNWKSRSLGLTGEYQRRVKFRQLGIARNRVWRFRISSPSKRDILGAVVKASGSSA